MSSLNCTYFFIDAQEVTVHVQVQTLFPAVIYEVDQYAALAIMIETLRELYSDIASAAVHLDPIARQAALDDVSRQIAVLEQARDPTPM